LSTCAKALTKDAQLEDPAQGKHKRPTLGKVTVNKPKGRGAVTEKGKAKEDAAQAMPAPPSKSAGVVMRNKSAATTAIPQSRQVLRSVAAPVPHPALSSRQATRSSVTANHVFTGTKATLHVDAMAIDPPDLQVLPSKRSFS
jgi:hypothetical protein